MLTWTGRLLRELWELFMFKCGPTWGSPEVEQGFLDWQTCLKITCKHWKWGVNIWNRKEAGGLTQSPEATHLKTGTQLNPQLKPDRSPEILFLSNCDWLGMILPKTQSLLGSEGPDYWFWWGWTTMRKHNQLPIVPHLQIFQDILDRENPNEVSLSNSEDHL